MATAFVRQQPSLPALLDALQEVYGKPQPLRVTDPLEMILWESIGYLVDDDRRWKALKALREHVGTSATKVLAAPIQTLFEITSLAGIVPEVRARRLHEIAELVQRDFAGDLRPALKKPLSEAKKELRKFPGIGDPGAEKILLFNKVYPVLALESNGLRVLLRLGFGEEKKSYSASYRSAQLAATAQLPQRCNALIRAHQLLRQHGQTLCKTSSPFCFECPLIKSCRFAAENPRSK